MQKNQHLIHYCSPKNNSQNYRITILNNIQLNQQIIPNFVISNKLFVYHLLNKTSNHN